MDADEKLKQAISIFDDLNSRDPNLIEMDGVYHPKELYDALNMSRWIDVLYPDAGIAVKIAARCQHLCRWEIPRSSYPEGRASYLKWRNDLKVFHARKSEEVLRDVGFGEQIIENVRRINLKKNLKEDNDVQAIEDALCMVFLETQFDYYIEKWDEGKMIRILQRTWNKMSPIARKYALTLQYSSEAKDLLKKAL